MKEKSAAEHAAENNIIYNKTVDMDNENYFISLNMLKQCKFTQVQDLNNSNFMQVEHENYYISLTIPNNSKFVQLDK